jgi:cell division protein FtsQ
MRLFSRKNKRKATFKSILIGTAKIIILFSIISAIAWSLLISNPTKFLNVSIQWKLDKELPISKEILITKIQPHLTDKYKIDLHQIKETIEQEPWVEQAQIKRIFWNYIKIKVVSKKIAMRWKNEKCISQTVLPNCFGFISTSGELFIPEIITESDAIQAISNTDMGTINRLYSDYKNYQSIIDPMLIKTITKTNIDKLEVEPNVTVILGYKMQSERLNRFKEVYSKLSKKSKKIKRATFDMRYPKGFSLSY